MDESTIAVVLNPAAGGGKALRLLPRVAEALQALDRPHHIHVTAKAGEAPGVARRFCEEGAAVVVAIGGDGTINEVVNGILASGRPVPLGLVPGGHGSDFVRSVEGSRVIDQAIRVCASGQTRPVDVGVVRFADGTERLFVNVAGLGFDTAVAERVSGTRLPGAILPYLRGVLGAMARYRNIQVSVEADGQQFNGVAASVLIANAKYVAGGMKIAPMAEVADGLLDVVILGDLTKRDIVANVPKVYKGTHVTHPKFSHFTARTVRVETIEPARIQMDGELTGYAPATFSVRPGALLLAG